MEYGFDMVSYWILRVTGHRDNRSLETAKARISSKWGTRYLHIRGRTPFWERIL